MDTLRSFAARCAERPWTALAAYLAVTAVLYFIAIHWPWHAPYVVQPTALDAELQPSTLAWLGYLSYFLVMPSVVLLTRRRPAFGALFCAGLACVLGNLALNLAFPTAIAEAPPGAAQGWLASLVMSLDTPLAALPSGHVSLPAALCLAAIVLDEEVSLVYGAWTLLLALCALATGQHYLPDIVAGLAWGACAGTTIAVLLLPPAPSRSMPFVRWPTVGAMLLECAINVGVIAWAAQRWDALSIVVAMLVVGTRQHALFILYHDAVHYNVARSRRLNDLITNLLIGIPQLLPVHVYRALHLSHHRDLGTPHDPERMLLFVGQPWQYQPLRPWPLLRQLTGDLLLINGVRTLRAFAAARRDPRMRLEPQRAWPELGLSIGLFAAALAWAAAADAHLLVRVLVLWLVPQLTVLQLLQKVRAFTEHGGSATQPKSNDWQVSWFGRATVWPYHINLHGEHHRNATVPWYQLPQRGTAGTPCRLREVMLEEGSTAR